MDIAFIGHGYHKKTKSSAFFIDLLREHHVTIYFDYAFNGGASVDIESILNADYDLIVVFQVEYVALKIAQQLPERLIFVPMFDGARHLPPEAWAAFRNARIVNFSWTLHEHLQRLGVPSLRVQYFPDPNLFEPVTDFTALRGFFWQRVQKISWPVIRSLCANQGFTRFHFHLAMDPDCGEPNVPDELDTSRFNVNVSHWIEDRKDLEKILSEANVYFAPRPCEGIGMSFLEAMARGQCVVAPDAPTMSEYMTHGVSGLLYDVEDPRPLDFCDARRIGANARRTIERGFVRWQRDQSDLLPAYLFGSYGDAFLLGDRSKRRLAEASAPYGAIHPVAASPAVREGGRRITEHPKQNAVPGTVPLVTVALVVRNARLSFLRTLSSVLEQSYPAKEVIVIDGNSGDGTLDLIRNKSDVLDYWKSEPDKGPYDGMNKAASVAHGRYILFMNAGDEFSGKDTLAEAMEGMTESDPDFIVGHHIYVRESGVEELHKAADFDDTWAALTQDLMPNKWLRSMPCHQATLTRTELLREQRYDTSYQIAADLEFLCRQRAAGARIYNCDVLLAIYFAGGLSSRNEDLCHREWIEIVRRYGSQKNADKLARYVGSYSGWRRLLKPRWSDRKWALGLSCALRRSLGGQ